MLSWLARVTEAHGSRAAFAWWCAHVVALAVVLVISNARPGLWFWFVGGAVSVSAYAGQIALNRRAARRQAPPPAS
jgi:hypothetical protein